MPVQISSKYLLYPPIYRSPNVRFASLRHWLMRSDRTFEASEARLLSRLRFFILGEKTDTSELKTTARVGLVDLDGDGKRKINTLVIDNNNGTIAEVQEKKNLVMCHGFGGGLGFFYRNYHRLSLVEGWRIYSIDWLGMGRSTRKTIEETVDEAENFFVDSLEKWRQVQKIEKMTLLGHSLGGYFAAVYALKYPQHVERLIMVSPVGIPPSPYEDLKNIKDNVNGRTLPLWLVKLWDANFTPQLLMRLVGPFGPSLISQYTSRRFANLDEQDRIDLHDYLYHVSAAPGSGEYALSRILAPGAYARKPLIQRYSNHGEEDWMDYREAIKASVKMNVPTKVIQIPHSGHHLYIDNPEEFDKAVINEMVEVANS
ncbi:3047_t:CDS:2 [Diversispora eburnea]|uniref:3047_t:CDS:1 n=1 Tax=Diversispora eburnea TaxID=1213867 RepID=A0A9N8YMY1_9GLOM|nr:3047_t:CDS:2 [Diversispora eburnea]